jgi:polyisoprenyl-phosphate glycosyltransferase
MKKLRVVVPVFNDWASCNILLQELDRVAGTLDVSLSVSAVNDGSTEEATPRLTCIPGLRNIESVEIVHLAVNLGHQRAIAIGLCMAVEDNACDAVLIMDSDGEDSPSMIEKLLAKAEGKGDFCVVAQRRRRSENFTFRLSYLIYKIVFRLLTASQIKFGNFSLLSYNYVSHLVRISDLWNNLPAAILRSKLPVEAVSIDRTRRYTGKSKMNLTSLIVHGLSGISVYAETIFVRLLLLSTFMVVMTVISVTVVLALRLFFPLHATPGWATEVSFGMAIILVQIISVTLSSILLLLNSRVQRLIIPIVDYQSYVRCRERLAALGAANHRGAVSESFQVRGLGRMT